MIGVRTTARSVLRISDSISIRTLLVLVWALIFRIREGGTERKKDSVILYCIVFDYLVFYCIVLYCNVLYFIAL